MIDKILIVNDTQAMIYYKHKAPVSVYSGSGNVLAMVEELLCPFNNAEVTTLTDWTKFQAESMEDTQTIKIK